METRPSFWIAQTPEQISHRYGSGIGSVFGFHSQPEHAYRMGVFHHRKVSMEYQLIGYSLAFMGFLSVLVQSWLVGRWSKRSGERKMTIAGLLLTIAGLCLVAFTDWA